MKLTYTPVFVASQRQESKFFDNFLIGPTQTCSNYKLDLLFTPAYVPFPSCGARDERKEKALSGNEGVEVPTRSLFFIFCSTKKIDFCFLYRIWTKYYWTLKTVQVLIINIWRRHLNISTQR